MNICVALEMLCRSLHFLPRLQRALVLLPELLCIQIEIYEIYVKSLSEKTLWPHLFCVWVELFFICLFVCLLTCLFSWDSMDPPPSVSIGPIPAKKKKSDIREKTSDIRLEMHLEKNVFPELKCLHILFLFLHFIFMFSYLFLVYLPFLGVCWRRRVVDFSIGKE